MSDADDAEQAKQEVLAAVDIGGIVGWQAGVAEAGAALIGVVAAELGIGHPVLERMLQRLGELDRDGVARWREGNLV